MSLTTGTPSAADLSEMYVLGLLDQDTGHPRAQLLRKLGTQELATLLGVTPETIRRQIKAGLIIPDTLTPGGHARFSRLTALCLYRSASPASAASAATHPAADHPASTPPHPQDLP